MSDQEIKTDIVATNKRLSEMYFPSRVYDVLKWIALIGMPATGVLVLTIGQIWGFEWKEEVSGTIMALNTFLGALLGISTHRYNKSGNNVDGEMILDTSAPDKDVLRIALDNSPKELFAKKKARFNIVKE